MVCDVTVRSYPVFEFGCLKLAHSISDASYDTLDVGELLVRYSRERKAIVEACAARSAPASASRFDAESRSNEGERTGDGWAAPAW